MKKLSFIMKTALVFACVPVFNQFCFAINPEGVEINQPDSTRKSLITSAKKDSIPLKYHLTKAEKLIFWEALYSKDSLASLRSFFGRHVEGKVYLHWKAVSQKRDGVYLICHSTDGKHYNIIGCEEGVGVNVDCDIAYYYVDKSPEKMVNYYKLLHITKSKTYILSSPITVTIPEKCKQTNK